MKYFIAVLIIIAHSAYVWGEAGSDSLLQDLENYLDKKDTFLSQKMTKIENLTKSYSSYKIVNNQEKAYETGYKLFYEYEAFIYDSAFKYIKEIKNAAIKLGNNIKITDAKIKMSFVLLSSGLFKEALDTLADIRIQSMPDSIKIDYYSVIAKTYFELVNYNQDSCFTVVYMAVGNKYLDSALMLTPQKTSEFWNLKSLREMKSFDLPKARQAFEYWLNNFKLNDHQYAIATSSLGYIYELEHDTAKAINMLIKSAIADIKSSTKETVALRNLANLIFIKGDVRTAYRFIKLALEDATFYNARHRKIEIASILPIIEGEKLNSVEKQRSILVKYSIAITLLSILVIVFFIIIFKQLKKLKKARKTIMNTYQNLLNTNSKLIEANKIKEEYIGHIFTANSEYLDKMERFQREVNRRITTRRFDDVKVLLRNIDLKKEREELFNQFDKIFLKLFPDFINEFNSFFKEEDRIQLKETELLNTDLRIFALIRLGITDNEKIAKILEYSVNTIYTYKTRVKNKSNIPNEEFEERIMKIKSI